MDDSSRKQNLSFCISLDLDSIENAISSDSETEGLQIDEIDGIKNPEQMKKQITVYDSEPEDEYLGFLKELYYQPVPKEVNINDDPEADPEYNILKDEKADILDKEELREDKAVKVSKKELNSLIAELDEFATKHVEQQEAPRSNKKKTPDASYNSLGTYSPGNAMVDLLPVLAQPQLPVLVNHEQRAMLSVQISQHVQLLVQQFVMTYKHTKYHQQSKISKDNLQSLITLSANSESYFLPQNLRDALKLVTDWESKLYDPIFPKEYEKYIKMEEKIKKQCFNIRKKHNCRFHPELIELMANSKSLMHPQLLPDSYPNSLTSTRKAYLQSEEHLVAIGLEQFIPYANSTKKNFVKMRIYFLMLSVKFRSTYFPFIL